MTRPTPNRLAREASLYLRQHAENPIDWYPWGEAAFERARQEGKPIFLSIGYAACHWCHVMERESFSDPRVGDLLDRGFVSIKVDREERPDVDRTYLRALQRLTGSDGGWPLSIFLTPDGLPFYGGMYFPPAPRAGEPSFSDVLRGVMALWSESRDDVVARGERLARDVRDQGRVDARADIDPACLDRSLDTLQSRFDPVWGGFGGAPKFPRATDLRLTLRHHARSGNESVLEMATRSLDALARGAIHDHLAGGFHRYTTDERWRVPHFEKMLYDTALLVPAYLEGFLVTRDTGYARVARRACEWVLREMRTDSGLFAASLDADADGVEGGAFLWSPEELERVLGPRVGEWARRWFGVVPSEAQAELPEGRFALARLESSEALARELGLRPADLETAMERASDELLRARDARGRARRDDKVVVSWNALMVSALASAHQVLGDAAFLDAARDVARRLLAEARDAQGSVLGLVSTGLVSTGGAVPAGSLADHAFLIQALIDLYETDFDEVWLRTALELEAIVERDFRDEGRGGYFDTSVRAEALFARLSEPMDGALPAGVGVQVLNQLRLAELSGRADVGERAARVLRSVGAIANEFPAAVGQLMIALDFLAAGPCELVVAGERGSDAAEAMLRVVRTTFLPQRVVARATDGADAELVPLVRGKASTEPRAYVCRHYACSAPAMSADALQRELAGLRGS